MPENPLLDRHAKHGAEMIERGGTTLPANFGDGATEHQAACSNAALFDLYSAGKLRVRGSERRRFLGALLAADVASLGTGQGCYSLLLTRGGNVSAEMRVVAFPDALVLLMASLVRTKVRHLLERLVVASDVTIEDATDSLGLLSVQGPLAKDVVGSALGRDLPVLADHAAVPIPTPNFGAVLVVRSPRCSAGGYDLLVQAQHVPGLYDVLESSVRMAGGCPAGLDALESLRIESGRPAFGAEMDEGSMPNEIALSDGRIPGVDLSTERCFLGAQALRRAVDGGHRERALCGLAFEQTAPPSRGSLVFDGRLTVGTVTSTCWSPSLGRSLALAMVTPDRAEVGHVLKIEGGPEGQVVALEWGSDDTDTDDAVESLLG